LGFLRGVSSVLILAVIPLLLLVPSSEGQGVTTITSLATVTTTFTRTSVSLVQGTETRTSTLTVSYSTTTNLPAQTLYRQSKTLATFGPEYGCLYDQRIFTAKHGQVVSMNLTSSTTISFFVMKGRDYDEWLKVAQCAVTSSLVEAHDVTDYYGELVVPEDGHYYFVFLNFFHDKPAKIQFTAKIIGVAAMASSTMTTTVAVLGEYRTVSETLVVTSTQTLSSIRTEETLFPLGQNSLAIVVLAGIAAIVVVLLAMRKRRRPETAAATASAQPIPQASIAAPSPVTADEFCMNCGASLPAHATFCNKCGAKQ